MKTTASQLLNKANTLMEQRGQQYDQPQGERSMGRAVTALNTILGRQALTESEGWLLLQILKDVRDRQRGTPHVDSLEDCVAYAALKAEARLLENKA
jgi:tRNA C32,U32 (ribose-2'-O)-methylase TrmJ